LLGLFGSSITTNFLVDVLIMQFRQQLTGRKEKKMLHLNLFSHSFCVLTTNAYLPDMLISYLNSAFLFPDKIINITAQIHKLYFVIDCRFLVLRYQ
jgi:hypothetical protein